jgi:hypothetical protein
MFLLKKYKITFSLFFGFILYGISSLIYIRSFELGHLRFESVLSDYLIFQIVTILIAFVYEFCFSASIQEKSFVAPKNKNIILVYVLFIICFAIFYFFPWTEDRESKMAQFAGFLRLLWFATLVRLLDGSKNDFKFLFLNIILMFIDSSRSTFAAIFLIHFFRRKSFNFFLISIGTISIFLVASIRSDVFDFSTLFESLFLFGFVGEGINGSLGSLQVLSLDTSYPESLLISLSSFLQPFLVLPKYFLFYLDFTKYLDTSHFYTLLIENQLGEIYYPMGGFFLVSQFVKLSYFGAFFLVIYMVFTLKLIRIIFRKADFAFLFTLLILMIKMSPFTFWKWAIYLLFITMFLKFFKIVSK